MTPSQLQEWHRRKNLCEEKDEIQEALIEWLSGFPWEWWTTNTLKPRNDGENHTLDYSRKCMRRFIADLSAVAWGLRWRDRLKGLYGIVAFEKHKSGSWHWHGLLAGTRGLRRMNVVDWCADHPIYGWARVFPTPTEKEIRYISKYMSKGPGMWEPVGVRWFNDPPEGPILIG